MDYIKAASKDWHYELIPVDFQANQIILASAWKAYKTELNMDIEKVDFLNSASSMVNPVRYQDFNRHFLKVFETFKLEKNKAKPVFQLQYSGVKRLISKKLMNEYPLSL